MARDKNAIRNIYWHSDKKKKIQEKSKKVCNMKQKKIFELWNCDQSILKIKTVSYKNVCGKLFSWAKSQIVN